MVVRNSLEERICFGRFSPDAEICIAALVAGAGCKDTAEGYFYRLTGRHIGDRHFLHIGRPR